MPSREAIGWALAAIGLICATAAAYLQGGLVAALSAASVGFTGLSAAFGYISKAPTK